MRRHDLPPADLPQGDPPVRDRPGDRYVRGPSAAGGGPRRSWHTRRTLWSRAGSALLLAILLAAAVGPWRADIFAPGDLAQPHAQILGDQTANNRCAACHVNARGRLADWFDSSRAGHEQVSQSQLCIECHHATISPERSQLAHNLTTAELRHVTASGTIEESLSRTDLTWHDALPRPSFGIADVQCSACHREHQGTMADLTWMSNTQCQTCHQDRFASFADGHPDWGTWPYGRGGQIAFDHSRHAAEHFSKQGRAFECRSCHEVATDGAVTRTGTFESACAACHDPALRTQAVLGIDLVALPMLDVDAAENAGIEAGAWPEMANGSDRITLAPLTRMLLAGDSETAAAVEDLTAPTANLWQGPPSPARLEATATLARGLRQLLDSLAADLHGEAARRLKVRPPAELLGQLSPQLIAEARQHWFAPAPPAESAAPVTAPALGDALLLDSPPGSLLDDSLLDDSLLQDPLLMQSSSAVAAENAQDDAPQFDPASMLPAGGWYRDDRRLAIRYRAAGHADPVLQAVMEWAADPSVTPADRDALLALPAAAACAECHRGAREGTWAGWTSRRGDSGRRGFTRFTHGPHMHLPALADCTHCHRVAPPPADDLATRPATTSTGPPITTVSTAATLDDALHPDFLPLKRETCAECHTPHAAGDRCAQCHRYHLDPP